MGLCCNARADTEPTYCFRYYLPATTLIYFLVIPSDYTGQLTSLLRYPPTPAPDPDEVMPPHPSSVLIRQALNLQMYPTPTSGTSVVVENRNLFNIPMEVPEPPPPPMRRQARNGDRSKSNASNSQPGSVRSAHGRNMSTQGMYLPEIARGLLDRGESLGINKSFMDAVSGLRVRRVQPPQRRSLTLLFRPYSAISPTWPRLLRRRQRNMSGHRPPQAQA